MLPLAHRMRHSGDFDAAVRRGRRAGCRTMVVHAAIIPPHPGEAGLALPPARVGLIVSRGVGPAVVRNRVKRRLRAVMRPRIGQLPPGALVVLRANPAAAAATSAEFTSDLDVTLTRALRRVAREAGAS